MNGDVIAEPAKQCVGVQLPPGANVLSPRLVAEPAAQIVVGIAIVPIPRFQHFARGLPGLSVGPVEELEIALGWPLRRWKSLHIVEQRCIGHAFTVDAPRTDLLPRAVEPVDFSAPRPGRRDPAGPRVRRQPRAVEIRTVAGPSRHVQCVLSGGPNTV